ncbi:MAG TPA: hypothetical protein V6C72_17235, partial [Chroococcales cyanobacterium]
MPTDQPADIKSPLSGALVQPDGSQSGHKSVLDAGVDLLRSCAYNAVQAPLEGVSQLVDAAAGTHLAKDVQFMSAPDAAKFGTLDWAAQQIGGAIGMAAPILLTHKSLAAGADALKLDQAVDLAAERMPALRFAAPIAQGAATGAIYGGILQPSQDGQPLLTQRLENAAISGVTFGTLAGTAMGLRELGSNGELQGTTIHY